jgi:hypothetical protein
LSGNIHGEITELKDILKRLMDIIEPESEWWRYQNLKAVGGYVGICLLMTLYLYGPFDKASQWIKTSKVPRSTFFLLRKELRQANLIMGNRIQLTGWGEKVCKLLESSPPIISKSRFFAIVENCKRNARF